MIDKGNLLNLFAEVDSHLKSQGLSSCQGIVIYGGAALISIGVSERATVDIDVFAPKIDGALEAAIVNVAEKYDFDKNWINSTGRAFVDEMPKGWRDRVQPLYKGEVLIVKILGRIDLIYTKFLAELDRGEDLEDLKSLKPTKSELRRIEEQLKSLEESSLWKQKVDEIIGELQGDENE